MITKNVLQLDENGYFVGISIADESPLQPGVFLIPRNCVDAAAPAVANGFKYKWNGTGFTAEVIPVAPAEPVKTADEIFNENIKQQIFELEIQLTQRRFREAGISGDWTFIQNIDTQIAALRVQFR